MSHTPTPWETGDNEVEVYQAAIVFNKDGVGVANCEQYEIHHTREVCEANAALIVEACNAHDALLCVVMRAERKISEYGDDMLEDDWKDILAHAREAIALCEEGK